MALNAYERIHSEIYDEVYSLLEQKDRESLRFAPVGTAELVLHADKLRRLFHSLLEPGYTVLDQFGVTEQTLITRVRERCLQPFLTVLIIAACSITTARTATANLVACERPPIDRTGTNLSSLPANKEGLGVLFGGNDVDADKFLGKQAYFCPLVIETGKETRVEDTNYRRLPYLEEQSVGNGSYGQVFRVKIAKGHFYDPAGGSANLEPLEIARKDYQLSHQLDPSGESNIMKKILASSVWDCPNILKSRGSLAFGPTVYSLFMPLAICDLRAYMMDYHEARPNSDEEKKDIIRCAMGLAGGLQFLHSEMRTPEMERLVCYHMDLKPANILIFRETGGDGRTHTVWKLSDFGMSRMKIQHSNEGIERERDLNRLFMRRSEPEDPSGTKNPRGEGTYLGPESVSPARTMGTHSDIWSLGCVLSILFTYMEDGSDGVRRYGEERVRHDSAGDRFFILPRGFKSAKLHPVITKTHARLVQRAIDRNVHEGAVVNSVLRYIENYVLQVDHNKRAKAKDIRDMLEKTFKDYAKLADHPCNMTKAPMKSRGGWARQMARTSRRRKDATDQNVETWFVSEDEAFKGCQISPDCSLVAYWTDHRILLYSAQSVQSIRGGSITPVGEYTLDRNDCLWDSIRLTERYLVASTTSATFHCYIFDLEKDGDLNHRYVAALPQPAISKLTISPGSQVLVCALRSAEDNRKPGALLILHLGVFSRMHSRLSSSTPGVGSPGISNRAPLPFPTDGFWKRSLEWPASTITRLSFTTKDDIYFMVRPETTATSRRHRVYVVHVNTTAKELHLLPIEPRGLDHSSTAKLFTTFAPFHRTPTTCAVVTREKQLHIHDLTAGESTVPIQKDIKNYRVLKLMMGSNDDKLYAVARQSTNYKLVLIEMTVPRSNADELRFKELAHLSDLSSDDQFTTQLSDADGGKYVLIASLVGNGQRAIRRVDFE
ncbi:kinase-like domain-containing protein [Aspergillus varians]